MKDTLVTGATGFIGSYLTEELRARGHRLRLLVRRRNAAVEQFEKNDAKIFIGDFTDNDIVRRAVENCGTVIHVAGATKKNSEKEYLEGNTLFTEKLLAPLAKEQRFILISSQAAAGPSTGNRSVTESDPPRPLTWYGRSKLAAEEAVKRWGADPDDNYLILRPCSVFGPGERDIYTIFRMLDRGVLTLLGTGEKRFSVVYVADLSAAIIAAAEGGVTGKTFFVSNDAPVSWREFSEEIRVAMGKKRVLRLMIPEWLAAPVGHTAGLIGKMVGKTFPVNGQKVIEMKQEAWICANDAIKKELGWRQRTTLDRAMRDTVEWYRRNGWLSA